MSSNAAYQMTITDIQIQTYLTFKEERDKLKKKLKEMDEGIKSLEQNYIEIIQNGGEVLSERILEVKEVSKRYPAWKEHFIDKCGKQEADKVLEITEPKSYLKLVIK